MRYLISLVLALAILLSVFPALAAGEHYNWYEVFVRSYQDSDGDGIGDLRGLISRLDYIRGLGYTALWLMPVMPSPSYHKYDVTDYKAVDSQYGSLEDIRALVSACRERGMALIVDLPLNHTSTRHPWFTRALDALRAGKPQDPAVAWYNFTGKPEKNHVQAAGLGWFYEEQFQGGRMPDLNLDNPEVRAEIRDIMAFWLVDIGVDGFRLDAVTSYYTGDDAWNIDFLRFLKDTGEAIKPGSFLVGECWAGLPRIAAYYGSGVDSFFLFPAAQAEGYIVSTLRARKPAQAYMKHLQGIYRAIPDGILTPFLCNHDTGRTVGLVQGRQAPERVKFAHALLSLVGGYAFTYYGDEIGMAGAGADPNKRLAMYWEEGAMTDQPPGATSPEYPYPGVAAQQADPASILNYLKALNHIRLDLPALALGGTAFGPAGDDTLVLFREQNGQKVAVAVNFSAREARDISLEGSFSLHSLLDAGEEASFAQALEGGIRLRLAPYGIAFLLAEGEGEP